MRIKGQIVMKDNGPITVMQIKGPQKATGTIKVSGAKNAVLPIMAATVLTEDTVVLKNVPQIEDVNTMIEILTFIGKKVERTGDMLVILQDGHINPEVPYEPVRKMRASFNIYGPLVVMAKKAKVSLPGGCALGARPVNFHIEGLLKLGIESTVEHGYVIGALRASEKNVSINLPFPSVGATEHIITSAVLLDGVTTTISNCALEPEILDLVNFLKGMGADIRGGGTPVVTVKGVKKLSGLEYSVIYDRIEAGTFAIMGALLGENLCIEGIEHDHLQSLFSLFDDMNLEYRYDKHKKQMIVSAMDFSNLKSVSVETQPYPGFATDLQPQLMVMLSLIPGRSILTENVFKSRFNHVDELNRMGAKIKVEGNTAIIDGVKNLSGALIMATDLRAAAALVIAALNASGESQISEIDHLFRGYEDIKNKFNNVGIKVDLK